VFPVKIEASLNTALYKYGFFLKVKKTFYLSGFQANMPMQ